MFKEKFIFFRILLPFNCLFRIKIHTRISTQLPASVVCSLKKLP
ncbi:MAG: hypothetical protein OT643_12225 [Bacteroidetes bacterium]|nr:hypothetical protein [Bacteroidota bacterium]